MITTLQALGWSSCFEDAFQNYRQQGFGVGRVAVENRHLYKVLTENGEVIGEVTGKMRFSAIERSDYPAVGDWVVLTHQSRDRATIHGILPRKGRFSRNVAGRVTEEQIVAANIDTVLLVSSLNADLNLRRIERYLVMCWEGGANPVIVLNKADLCPNPEELISEVNTIACGVPVYAISAATGQGLTELASTFQVGETIALLGSSGVGKSSIVNYLLGQERQTVSAVREVDAKGRHTTTHRELFVLEGGAILIDTPGMRELQLWESSLGLEAAFADVESLVENCRFSDCSHNGEPGCAVGKALESGALTHERFQSYQKMQAELKHLERKEAKKKRQSLKKDKAARS